MKNKILKLSVLVVVAMTLFTGCQKKEGEVSKVKKNESDEKIVVKVDIDSIDTDDEKIKLYLNAKTSTGETVWKKYIATVPVGIGLETLIGSQGEKYYYYGNGDEFEALDIQTGNSVWSTKAHSTLAAANAVEIGDKVYFESGMAAGYSLEVFDIKTGKSLKYIEDIDSAIPEPNGNMQHSLNTSSMKADNNVISFEVNLDDASGHYVKRAGYLKINIDNYKISFEEE